MRSPTLAQLSPPPYSKTGWPWTEESPQLPPTMVDGSLWPKISIITPSYNQGQFIEETIRSVLLQGYPNLEYFIIDGGSTDNSVELIKKYEPWLAYWVSEPDRGQSHAINKGMERTTGEIVAWLNSDDYYLSSAFAKVAPLYSNGKWILGATQTVEDDGALVQINAPVSTPNKRVSRCFKIETKIDFPTAQPGNFWSKDIWNKVGLLNEKYHYCMDLEWMFRAMAVGYHPIFIMEPLASLRLQSHSKTITSPRAFDIDRARIFFDLGRKGVFHLLPALRLSRRFASQGLRKKSDELFFKGKHVSSLMATLAGWLLSERLVGGSFWLRVKRVFINPAP